MLVEFCFGSNSNILTVSGLVVLADFNDLLPAFCFYSAASSPTFCASAPLAACARQQDAFLLLAEQIWPPLQMNTVRSRFDDRPEILITNVTWLRLQKAQIELQTRSNHWSLVTSDQLVHHLHHFVQQYSRQLILEQQKSKSVHYTANVRRTVALQIQAVQQNVHYLFQSQIPGAADFF
ncbi:hypothetical protein Tsp_11872 [Trichinella spiralis]|uniref:hypothetical protein n=1 Tax=Trichinella spiralis TaxID=6334 RepID=UPI0001EFDB63|nr:hypothetical protein Tsp_11872 [Trichinella spiralis]